jgi:hypothetical protein
VGLLAGLATPSGCSVREQYGKPCDRKADTHRVNDHFIDKYGGGTPMPLLWEEGKGQNNKIHKQVNRRAENGSPGERAADKSGEPKARCAVTRCCTHGDQKMQRHS